MGYMPMSAHVKKALLAAMMVAVLCSGCTPSAIAPGSTTSVSAGDQTIANAFKQHRSGVRVSGEGVVSALLPDDNESSRHQRFILRLASGQTLLFAHNIDIAPRLPSLKLGDTVVFEGVYEWNAQGGLVHWTHRDPSGEHPTGWLRYNGRIYQ